MSCRSAADVLECHKDVLGCHKDVLGCHKDVLGCHKRAIGRLSESYSRPIGKREKA